MTTKTLGKRRLRYLVTLLREAQAGAKNVQTRLINEGMTGTTVLQEISVMLPLERVIAELTPFTKEESAR